MIIKQNEQEGSSSSQINKLLDSLIATREKTENVQNPKVKTKKVSSPKIGGSPLLPPNQLQSKIVKLLSSIILKSQTFFFVPILKDTETFSEIIPFLERCSK